MTGSPGLRMSTEHLSDCIHNTLLRCAQRQISPRRQRRLARYAQQASQCGEEIHDLERFVNAQVVAFRKILKKYKVSLIICFTIICLRKVPGKRPRGREKTGNGEMRRSGLSGSIFCSRCWLGEACPVLCGLPTNPALAPASNLCSNVNLICWSASRNGLVRKP